MCSIVAYGAALEQARRVSGDLLFVARQAQPPVVKIGSAKRVHYERKMQEKEARKKQLDFRKAQAMKEASWSLHWGAERVPARV